MAGERSEFCHVARILVAAALVTANATSVPAQLNLAKPKELDGVGVTEHLDAQVPLDLEFADADGRPTTLGDLFDEGRPVILTLNYSDCPRLCSVQLNALVDAIRKMDWNLGDQYQIVTVSIDPTELPERAKLTKQKYLRAYGRPGAAGGWRFLVGSETNIKKLTDMVGFDYAFDGKEYLHVAVLFVCTPEGRVSRYLYGVDYDPQTLRLSMVEAGEGKIGSSMDQILLYCFHYDSASGRYGPAAFRLMRIGGLLTVVVLGTMLSVYWLREKRKSNLQEKNAP